METTKVSVCTDCIMIAANGELGGYDPDGELARAHAEKMVAHWGEPFSGPHAKNASDGHFSSASCDTCGETLAGDRFDAVVLSR